MTWARIGLVLMTAAGCKTPPDPAAAPPAEREAPIAQDEPPVALNPDPPVVYPTALMSQRVGGVVLLRIFVDSAGFVRPESTTVQESSGYPALDSAALAAGPQLRYAPALRAGNPVAGFFLQRFSFQAPRR